MAGRRIALTLVGALGALLLIAVAWIVVTGVLARSRLDDVRSQLSAYEKSLSAGDTTRARAIGSRIERDAGSAHQLTSGPAWWVGSHILAVGTPLQTARTISLAADRLASGTVSQVSDAIGELEHEHQTPGAIDLGKLRRTEGRLADVRTLVGRAVVAVRSSSPSWFEPVSGGRHALLTKLASLDGDVDHAEQAVQTIIPMLGEQTPQRYFVAFLNEAESRSIGGLPGAFAIVTADHGRITFDHFGSDTELAGVRAQVDLGTQYNSFYAQDDPSGVIQNSDIGPNFPDAARIWAGMWLAKTGEHIDGALSIDPSALGFLLRVTGPARLSDGTLITATNVANLTQAEQYVRYPGFLLAQKAQRQQFLDSIAQAVSRTLLHSRSLIGLAQPLHQAVRERRILAWSDVPGLERAIVAAGLGGVLQPGHAPFSAFTVNNSTGSKLDFYLHRTMTYRSSGCAAGRTATATFTLDNETPSYSLPAYVTYVAGGRPAGTKPGWNRLIVTYYATPGAVIRSVSLNGVAQHLTPAIEDSLSTVRLLVPIAAGARSTLTVVTTEPASRGPVQIVAQPLVYAMHVHAIASTCEQSAVDGAGGVGAWPFVVAGLLLLVIAVVLWRLRGGAAHPGAPPTGPSPESGQLTP